MASGTQSELARKLKLSRSTVAAALNPNSTVKLREETVKLVQQAASRTNYRPHRYAQIMRAGKSGMIGIFHFGGLSQVAAERTWHASRAARAAGYQILACDVSWTPDGTREGCEAMLDARVEGVIVAGLNDPAGAEELKRLRTAKIPIVTLSGKEVPGAPHIRGDAERAIFKMTRHLMKLGRRKLLLMISMAEGAKKGTSAWWGAERLKGFQKAFQFGSTSLVPNFSARSGGPIEGCVVTNHFPLDRFNPFLQGQQTLDRILATPPHPDAVICSNDEWAIGALATCNAKGLRVPEDIAITGFDNISVGNYLNVPLTTIDQPNKAMAERAVEILLKSIKGGTLPRNTKLVIFPCKLVVRSSCGARMPRPRK